MKLFNSLIGNAVPQNWRVLFLAAIIRCICIYKCCDELYCHYRAACQYVIEVSKGFGGGPSGARGALAVKEVLG